jgi:hypothetical protein
MPKNRSRAVEKRPTKRPRLFAAQEAGTMLEADRAALDDFLKRDAAWVADRPHRSDHVLLK